MSEKIDQEGLAVHFEVVTQPVVLREGVAEPGAKLLVVENKGRDVVRWLRAEVWVLLPQAPYRSAWEPRVVEEVQPGDVRRVSWGFGAETEVALSRVSGEWGEGPSGKAGKTFLLPADTSRFDALVAAAEVAGRKRAVEVRFWESLMEIEAGFVRNWEEMVRAKAGTTVLDDYAMPRTVGQSADWGEDLKKLHEKQAAYDKKLKAGPPGGGARPTAEELASVTRQELKAAWDAYAAEAKERGEAAAEAYRKRMREQGGIRGLWWRLFGPGG